MAGGEDQADGQPLADEVLDIGGQLRDLRPVGGMDLVNGDDQSRALNVQQTQQFVPGASPVGRPFRGKLGCQAESCHGKGCDFPGSRPVPELLDESEHVVADSGQEPRRGRPGDDRQPCSRAIPSAALT